MLIPIDNFANRKFGETLRIREDGNPDKVTARFISAVVDESGVATVHAIPDGMNHPFPFRTDEFEILRDAPDHEWVTVTPGALLEGAKVRFTHRLTDSVIYPTQPLSVQDLPAAWEFEVPVCARGTLVTVDSEYWVLETEQAVPEPYGMPTIPGLYTARNGHVFQYDPSAPWNAVWRNLTVGAAGTAEEARDFAPFTGPMRA